MKKCVKEECMYAPEGRTFVGEGLDPPSTLDDCALIWFCSVELGLGRVKTLPYR